MRDCEERDMSNSDCNCLPAQLLRRDPETMSTRPTKGDRI